MQKYKRSTLTDDQHAKIMAQVCRVGWLYEVARKTKQKSDESAAMVAAKDCMRFIGWLGFGSFISPEEERRYLKAQNDKLKAASDPTTQKFAVYFEEMNDKFGKMLALLPLMDDEAKAKFSGALGRALDAMKAKL